MFTSTVGRSLRSGCGIPLMQSSQRHNYSKMPVVSIFQNTKSSNWVLLNPNERKIDRIEVTGWTPINGKVKTHNGKTVEMPIYVDRNGTGFTSLKAGTE